MRALLDINVWIALFDTDHAFAARANAWVAAEKPAIATCPLVENGVVRIMCQPGYSSRAKLSIPTIVSLMRQACEANDHEFWPDDVSLRDPAALDVARLHGPRQITDAYLLALAVANKGRFVTFDESVPLSAVRGAGRKNLLVV
jgi:hypothetical protein